MRKIISALACLFLFVLSGNSQIYRVQFDAVSAASVPIREEKDSTGEKTSMGSMPVTAFARYEVQADSFFLEITGTLIGSHMKGGAEVNVNTAKERVIIDLRRMIAFFPDEAKYEKVEVYSLNRPCRTDSLFSGLLLPKKRKADLQFDSRYPWFISPGLLLGPEFRCGAISYLHLPGKEFRMMTEPVITEGRLEYESFFSGNPEISGQFRFL
ncbi:MAG: hypothetical protein IAE96_03660 [Chitinophagaceae bacterium]|nr:hypothetical protein [Chitinophagaceae bacterium]